jgi:hypothetical protein
MCESPYIPSGYKIGEFPRRETVRSILSLSLARLTFSRVRRQLAPPLAAPLGSPLALRLMQFGIETSGSVVLPTAVAGLHVLELTYDSVPLDKPQIWTTAQRLRPTSSGTAAS